MVLNALGKDGFSLLVLSSWGLWGSWCLLWHCQGWRVAASSTQPPSLPGWPLHVQCEPVTQRGVCGDSELRASDPLLLEWLRSGGALASLPALLERVGAMNSYRASREQGPGRGTTDHLAMGPMQRKWCRSQS